MDTNKTYEVLKRLSWFCIGLLSGLLMVQLLDENVTNNSSVYKPKINYEEVKLIANYIKCKNIAIPVSTCRDIGSSVEKASRKYNVPIELIIGIMKQESCFNPTAISNARAKGLMQILNGGVEIPIDPSRAHDINYNINIGIQILLQKVEMANGEGLEKALEYYSGNAKNFSEKIYCNMGDFILWRIKAKEKENNF